MRPFLPASDPEEEPDTLVVPGRGVPGMAVDAVASNARNGFKPPKAASEQAILFTNARLSTTLHPQRRKSVPSSRRLK